MPIGTQKGHSPLGADALQPSFLKSTAGLVITEDTSIETVRRGKPAG